MMCKPYGVGIECRKSSVRVENCLFDEGAPAKSFCEKVLNNEYCLNLQRILNRSSIVCQTSFILSALKTSLFSAIIPTLPPEQISMNMRQVCGLY